MSNALLKYRRAQIEAKVEELFALRDLLDGDENLEHYLADTGPDQEDREDEDEREHEETDENGGEQDCSRSEDEWSSYPGGELRFDGSGVVSQSEWCGVFSGQGGCYPCWELMDSSP